MFKVKGECINSYDVELPNKKKATVIQVLCNGGKSKKVIDITDYYNRQWNGGEIEIPVYISAYKSKSGNVGLNIVAAQD